MNVTIDEVDRAFLYDCIKCKFVSRIRGAPPVYHSQDLTTAHAYWYIHIKRGGVFSEILYNIVLM